MTQDEAGGGEGRCTKRRVNVEEVLAIDVVVGKMAKMHFIEGHLRRVLDQVVASEEGQDDDGEQDRQAILGQMRGRRLRERLILVEHV